MAQAKKTTFICTNNNRAINGQGLFYKILEFVPKWKIIAETLDEGNEIYQAFFKMPDSELLFEFQTVGSNVYTNCYYENPNGNLIVADKRYNTLKTDTKSHSLRINANISIYFINEEEDYERIIFCTSNSNFLTYGKAKIIDICSNEERIVATIGDTGSGSVIRDYLHSYEQNSYRSYYTDAICSGAYDNGYAKMIPSFIYGEKFIGKFANPLLSYYGYSQEKAMDNNTLLEFSIGGIRFLSYGSNYAIRLDDTMEVI